MEENSISPSLVSIVIVNFNTGGLLRNCLESIRKNVSVPFEVIVSDNGSADGSMEMCGEYWEDRRFRKILNGSNLGFSRANNIGAACAEGKILHFLNPDTELSASISDDYAVALSAPDKVYVNTLYNLNGTVENSRKPITSVRDLFWWNVRRSKARYWYIGASVIISRDNYDRIGGWSEDYFLYSEDLDLFRKIWDCGIEIGLLPSGIFHLGGGSSGRIWNKLERETAVQKSFRIYFRKHSNKAEYIAVKLYFLLFTALKYPKDLPVYIKAWYYSGKS